MCILPVSTVITHQKTEIEGMMALIEQSGIHPIIAGRFTLHQISDAHLLAEQRGQIGKIVVTV